MFIGDEKTQGDFNRYTQQRLREYEQGQRRYAKDQLRVQRLSFLRAGLASAVQTAPLGLFEDFELEAAASAALDAGLKGA